MLPEQQIVTPCITSDDPDWSVLDVSDHLIIGRGRDDASARADAQRNASEIKGAVLLDGSVKKRLMGVEYKAWIALAKPLSSKVIDDGLTAPHHEARLIREWRDDLSNAACRIKEARASYHRSTIKKCLLVLGPVTVGLAFVSPPAIIAMWGAGGLVFRREDSKLNWLLQASHP